MIDDLVRAITASTYRYASEAQLQHGLLQVLIDADFEVIPEAALGRGDRIDFIVDGEHRVGIEVKVAGNASELHWQLVRYAQYPEIDELLVVSTRAEHTSIPSVINGKPCTVVHLRGGLAAVAPLAGESGQPRNGTLTWLNGSWYLAVAPHIAIRVKRLFPRAEQGRTGLIGVKDTPDVARDLEWLIQRHPLTVDDATLTRLTAAANQHRETEATRLKILAGERRLGLREPARQPRDYQLVGAELAHLQHRLLIADDVGLGKTFTSMLLFRDPEALPAVVVTLTHLPKQWLRELEISFPWLKGHVVTKGTPYPVDADVLIMNYHKLAGWCDHLAGDVKTIIFDECQELRHAGTVKYTSAAMIADKASWRVGLSATPVYNYGSEIHSIMSVLDEDSLGTRTEFLREWGSGDAKGRVTNPQALGTYLRDQGLLLRRTRVDVHRELPDPVKILHDIPADPKALEEVSDDVAALADLILNGTGKERFASAGELDWRLRQATGIAKAPFVAEFVKLLLESEEKVVLFGWHRAVYTTWAKMLQEFDPVLYSGSETANQKQAAVDEFVNGHSRILMMSLRSGAGLDGLQTAASVIVFGELDWSPAMHDQCIGRLARDGQEATVVAYYLVTDSGSDPVIADVLNIKRQQAEPIRDPDTPLVAGASDNQDRMKALAAAVLERRKP